MKKSRWYEVVSVALVILGLLMFNWALGRLNVKSTAVYMAVRLLMGMGLMLAGFSLEWERISKTSKITFDWVTLLILGLPALILAWLPFFVHYLNLPLPELIWQERLPAESVGAFFLGIALGKSFR
ncbi:hypothetical protein ciss_22850 [Carboxydothermus islandicus]|uniref:Uncharacterized protein n=1 Tax=Carboxydothermus islandicus TaxID=661089 RepID=A0A1L8D5B2_9THEO|nr:hypothetical protein [Carboxydothermus islandicus]GAV26352.1 hypothetical protein ciss_22850 [Carboxydothermus islandicus]